MYMGLNQGIMYLECLFSRNCSIVLYDVHWYTYYVDIKR